jgi:drug/metabolite transporter (DMT)-like permease
MNKFFQQFKLSGRLSLIIAIVIFGSASAVTRKLTELGANNLIDGRNPISFCNVLFVGNLCALILLTLIYYRDWNRPNLQRISKSRWLTMAVVSILGTVVTPTLIFMALAITPVNNIILVGQLDAPLILLFSIWIFKDRVNAWIVTGAILSCLGIFLTVILKNPDPTNMVTSMGVEIGKGELFVMMAAGFKVIGNLVSRISLQKIPLAIFSPFRMAVGTVAFFVMVLIFYGPSHLMDVGSPFLWQWIILYSGVIVVLGQLLWFNGLSKTTASDVSLANSFSPIAGVLAAYLILREVPTQAQYIGGIVILGGIIFTQLGIKQLSSSSPERIYQPSEEELAEAGGFKGV